MYPDTSWQPSRTEIYVESTEAGIRQVDVAVDDSDSGEDSDKEDSEFGDNAEICMLEKLDFDTEVVIDSDLEEDN